MTAKIITITNQKGGTGKTSTTLFLAYGLAQRGYKSLVIDLDQQADATFSLAPQFNNADASTFELLTGQVNIKDIIQQVNLQIDIAPASNRLAQLDIELYKQGNYRADLLKEQLRHIRSKYDYILIDTPPALSMVISNALTAADYVLIPTQADVYSLKGLADLAQTINEDRQQANPKLKIAGILIGRYNARTVYSQSVSKMLGQAAKQLNTRVFKTRIREAIAVKEAQHKSISIFDYDKSGKVTHDINKFIGEFLGVINND